jgi:hypothetical protein
MIHHRATEATAQRSRSQNKLPWRSALQKSPLPLFTKGGLGGISEVGFPNGSSLQNLESLNISSTEKTFLNDLERRSVQIFRIIQNKFSAFITARYIPLGSFLLVFEFSPIRSFSAEICVPMNLFLG